MSTYEWVAVNSTDRYVDLRAVRGGLITLRVFGKTDRSTYSIQIFQGPPRKYCPLGQIVWSGFRSDTEAAKRFAEAEYERRFPMAALAGVRKSKKNPAHLNWERDYVSDYPDWEAELPSGHYLRVYRYRQGDPWVSQVWSSDPKGASTRLAQGPPSDSLDEAKETALRTYDQLFPLAALQRIAVTQTEKNPKPLFNWSGSDKESRRLAFTEPGRNRPHVINLYLWRPVGSPRFSEAYWRVLHYVPDYETGFWAEVLDLGSYADLEEAKRAGEASLPALSLLASLKKNPKLPFTCADFPEDAVCRDFTPSAEFPTRKAYLRHVGRCRQLARLANAGDARAAELYKELDCKREGHLYTAGGRLKSRFPQEDVPAQSEASAQRLKKIQAPLSRRTQSPEIHAISVKRHEEKQRPEEEKIARALQFYGKKHPAVEGLGFLVPQHPRPLMLAGMPRKAAVVLVERAGSRLLLWHSDTEVVADKGTPIDYKNLQGVSLSELPAVLARISSRKTRRGRKLSPLTKTNPSMPLVVDADQYSELAPGEAAPLPGKPGYVVYRNKEGQLKSTTAKRAASWQRAGQRARAAWADYKSDSIPLKENPMARHPYGRDPFRWDNANVQEAHDFDDFDPYGYRWGQFGATAFQPVSRKNTGKPRKKAKSRNNPKKLTAKQLAAGFGGKSAMRKASKSRKKSARKNPSGSAQAKKAMQLYHSGQAPTLKAAWQMVKSNPRVRVGAKKGGYWVRDGAFSPRKGQFGQKRFQPVNRRNPRGDVKTALFPGECAHCGGMFTPGKDKIIDSGMRGPRGGKKMIHVKCG